MNKKRNKNKISKYKKKKSFFKIVKDYFVNDKDSYCFGEVIMITIISLIVGAIACLSVITIIFRGRNYFKLSRELEKFVDVYETINDNYYEEIDKNSLIDAAINGMLEGSLDNYTNYANSEGAESFDDYVNSSYEGIGCLILQNGDKLTIVEVYENSPSYKAGLKVDDEIISVDDKSATIGATALSNYIKKEAKGSMKIIVKRDEEELSFDIKRDKVEVPTVGSKIYEMNGKKIGYIGISIFSENTDSYFKKELYSLEHENIDGLVIDVRGNSGGYLTSVSKIIKMFTENGKPIYQVKKNDKVTTIYDDTDELRSYPVAVLVDGASASASEILAAAFKETYNGIVVGTTTFGKGTVQQVKKLSDGSMLKYTVENWLSPEGNWIDKVGVSPTYEVELGIDYFKNPIDENDLQLQKALKMISE